MDNTNISISVDIRGFSITPMDREILYKIAPTISHYVDGESYVISFDVSLDMEVMEALKIKMFLESLN